jgi:uncharacterized protein
VDKLKESYCDTNPNVDRNRKRLKLSSIPHGLGIEVVFLDLTLDCNLRCVYCFKTEKEKVHMQERVAFDAAVWLLHACAASKQAEVFFMGGEPLVNYTVMKRLVPFARRRAAQDGINLTLGMATNCTLVSDEVVAFAKRWEVALQNSIDGIPEVQDFNRPTITGGPSSHLVERASAKILEADPGAVVRSTVIPETVSRLYEGYLYFRKLGYLNIAMVFGDCDLWDNNSLAVSEEQFMRIADAWIEDLRGNTSVWLKNMHDFLVGRNVAKRLAVPCGAALRGVAIDVHGNIWPCSRMTKEDREKWCLGSIYGEFNHTLRSRFLEDCKPERFLEECDTCIARGLCAGGCPAENLQCSGDLYAVHPYRCEMCRVWARVGKYAHDILYKEKNPLFMQQYYPEEWRKMNPKTEDASQSVVPITC